MHLGFCNKKTMHTFCITDFTRNNFFDLVTFLNSFSQNKDNFNTRT